LEFLWFLVTGFIFSMFSGLVREKAPFRSFVFKMFPGLGFCEAGRHKVAMQFVGGACQVCHYQFLVALRAGRRGEASSQEFRRRFGLPGYDMAGRRPSMTHCSLLTRSCQVK
jgi:hypothetical protein